MTRRLSALRIGNFKAFAETQRIPIKPITLVFGPNSSGKSSFIHSLALAHEAMRSGLLDIHRTEIGGSSIDLGGFRQFVHKTDRSKRVVWGIDLDVDAVDEALRIQFIGTKTISLDLAFGLEGESPDALIDLSDLGIESEPVSQLHAIGDQAKANAKDEAKVVVVAYELSADGSPILRMSRRKDGGMAMDSLSTEHPVFRRIVDAIAETGSFKTHITDAERMAVVTAINELVPKFSGRVVNFLPELDPVSSIQGGETGMALPVLAPDEPIENTVRLFFPRQVAALMESIHQVVRREIGALAYLGPLRSFPARHMAFAEHDDRNWFAGGGFAWDVVKRNAAVREQVNLWLGAVFMKTPYRLGVRALVGLDQIRGPLAIQLEELVETLDVVDDPDYSWIPQIDDSDKSALQIIKALRDSNIDKVTELVLIDQRSKTVVSHRDVGIGISQALPVLVQAFASRGQVIAMEQPEIHLHPALQAELGDVFIEAAIGDRKNTLILETHSEHLVLRLLRRIRETSANELAENLVPLTPKDICVLYAQPTERGTVMLELAVTADGDFESSWPDGFFAERAKELF